MGHHAKDIASIVADPCDVILGAIGVVQIAKNNLVVVFEGFEGVGVGLVAAFAMGDRQGDVLAEVVVAAEGQVVAFDAEGRSIADEVQSGIAGEGSGEESSLGQDLEAVADAEDGFTGVGMVDSGAQGGGEAGDRTAAQVVAVAKSAGNDDDIDVTEIAVLVPDHLGGLAEEALGDPLDVAIAVGAGEDDDAKFHFWCPTWGCWGCRFRE